jgi:hypothetical protein
MTISIEAEGKETSSWAETYLNFVGWHKAWTGPWTGKFHVPTILQDILQADIVSSSLNIVLLLQLHYHPSLSTTQVCSVLTYWIEIWGLLHINRTRLSKCII